MKALRMSSRNGSLWHVLNLPVFVPFLRLPAKIRNRIYKYALRLDGICYLREGEDFPEPALLFTCRTIRREAIGIFYSENTFDAAMDSYSPSMPTFLLTKDEKLRAKYECRILSLTLTAQGPKRWKNLLSWLKQVHAGGPISLASIPKDQWPLNMNPRELRLYQESAFVAGLMATACQMRRESWEAVETTLTLLRSCECQILAQVEPRSYV